MTLIERINTWLDGLIPAGHTTPQEVFQLRLLIGGSLLGLGMSTVSVGVSMANSWPGPAVVVGTFGVGCIALMVATKAGATLAVLRRSSMLLVGSFLVVESLQTAEIDWAQFKWLVLLPLLASVLSEPSTSRRAVVQLWTGTGFAILLGGVIVFANRMQWTAGMHVPRELPGDIPFYSLIDFAQFAICVAGLLTIHSLAQRRLERELTMLRSLLCVCAWCRRIRDDDEGWVVIEHYMTKHSSTAITHGICTECAEKVETTQR